MSRATISHAKPMTKDQLRSDFEISLLFPNDEKPEVGPGSLKRTADGAYESPTINSAWLGYQMCAKYAHALLARFDPDRSIHPGMVNRVREAIGKPHANPERVEELARAVLKVVGDSPT